MPPFAQFREWLRDGPPAERLLVGAAATIAVFLIVLALMPVTRSGAGGAGGAGVAVGSQVGQPSAVQPATGSAQSPVAPAGAGVTGGGPSAGPGATGSVAGAAVGTGRDVTSPAPTQSGPAPSGGTGTAQAVGACDHLIASAPGVTPTTVHVDYSYVNLAGAVGNAAFGIPSNISQMINAMVDWVNSNGGVACGRKLVVTQYQVNPVDSNDQQSKCLQMVSDHPFAVVDGAGYVTPVSLECFVQNHQLMAPSTSMPRALAASSYPYLYNGLASTEEQVRNAVLGLAARDYFKSPHFTGKLGVLEDSCDPPANQEIAQDLAASGVPASQVSTYVLDCQLISPPNEVAQAVLQNKVAGDTEVFLASSISNSQNYVKIADQQSFQPAYLTTDYGSNTAGAQTWDSGFDNAVAVTSTAAGELDSGIHNAAETKCNALMVARGIAAMADGKSSFPGGVCDTINLFIQGIDHDGANPTQLGMIQGLGTSGLFAAAVGGNSDWTRVGQVTGGNFQRAVQYHVSCQCWRVVDPSTAPSY